MTNFNPTQTGLSRVFIIEGRARGDHEPDYQTSLRATALSKGFGDVTSIELPSAVRYNEFDEVAEIKGEDERATLGLEGLYALDIKSTLLRLARHGCPVDVQIHMGECTDPRDFDSFEKILILENASQSSYDTEDLGTLSSADRNPINESSEISAKDPYEVVPLVATERAASIVTNEVIDVTICDQESCGGDCDDPSDGCQKFIAVTLGAGGSPGTPPDIIYTLDGGTVWYAHDIETLLTGENASGVACVSKYVVVTSNDAGSISYCLKSEIDGATDPTFTEVTTGIVAGGEPNAIISVGDRAFIVGDDGYVYLMSDVTAGVTVLDAGVATIDNLNAVDALSDTFAVAVGNSGAVVYTEDGVTWSAATHFVGVGVHLQCVAVKTTKEWWVGTNDGRMFVTYDKGVTWAEKTFSGSGTGVVHDIYIATDSVFYMAHATTAPAGRIFRSYNGGYTWNLLQESNATIPANDQVNALAACGLDPNLVVGVGLGDNASDGYVVVAKGT